MSIVTRRSVLRASAATSLLGLLPNFSAFAAPQQGDGGSTSFLDLFILQPVTSSTSEVLARRLFPGLLDGPSMAPLLPFIYLLHNVSGVSLKAFTVLWTMNTSHVTLSWPEMYYFHPRINSYYRMHWGITGPKTFSTASIPAIKAGAVRLLSPYFNWSPKYWANPNRPNWQDILNKRPRVQIRQIDISDPSVSVRGSIIAAITSKNQSMGTASSALVEALCNTRNAEHDQARYTLRQINAGLASDEMSAWLKEQAGLFAQKTTSGSDLYYRVRQRQTTLFANMLRTTSLANLKDTAAYLSRRRRMLVSPMGGTM